jgi:polar amino acid transport system substrate-binding protein
MSLSRARFGTPALARTALLAGAVTVALAGCAPQSSGTSTSASASTAPAGASSSAAAGLGGDCAKDKLTLKTAGKLTVGTDKPAFAPWFVDDDPTNGKGFESAVAFAVADRLGFARTDVTWVTASFNSVVAPGPKNFDFDINQVSITEERKAGIDFSSGYYDVSQSVITVKGSKAAGVKSIADLAKLKLGAQTGTTSFKAINDVIKPADKPAVFNTNDDAKLALANGQIDAMVVDLPTGLFLSAVGAKDGGVDNGVLLGQLPNSSSGTEQFGLVLDKGSALTSCVSQAVDALRADGTLKQLETTWLTETAGAPVLS